MHSLRYLGIKGEYNMNDIFFFLTQFDLQKSSWLIAFIFGIVLFVWGILCLIPKSIINNPSNYAKAALLDFLACWIMYIPEVYFNSIPDNPKNDLRIVESIATSLLKSINIYSGNGYERAIYVGHPIFSSIYGIIRVAANISLFILIGGFIVNIFESWKNSIILNFRGRNNIYIFTAHNTKSISIAKSIASEPEKQKKEIVFLCPIDSVSSEAKKCLDNIKALCINTSLERIIRTNNKKKKEIKVFIFGDDENNNLDQLEGFLPQISAEIKCKIAFYLELIDTPSGVYDYDDSKKESIPKVNPNITINLVRTEENFVYNLLFENNIFERTIQKEDKKEIKILIVGNMNNRNLELLKAVLHLGQMPGYEISVFVIEDKHDRARLRQMMPEIHDNCSKVGDAVYSLHFFEDMEYASYEFEELIKNVIPDFTYAFVNVGNEIKNMEMAMRIQGLRYRIDNSPANYIIHASVSDSEKFKRWNPKLLKNIVMVGDFASTYNYNFITMSKIEKASIEIHKIRHNGEESWNTYCNSEYKRRSVYARTLSTKYRILEIDKNSNSNDNEKYAVFSTQILDSHGAETNIWKIYEHMRWNVYTRTLGYQFCSNQYLKSKLDGDDKKTIRQIAMIHPDLRNFEELPHEEQVKDSINITKEIVDLLK